MAFASGPMSWNGGPNVDYHDFDIPKAAIARYRLLFPMTDEEAAEEERELRVELANKQQAEERECQAKLAAEEAARRERKLRRCHNKKCKSTEKREPHHRWRAICRWIREMIRRAREDDMDKEARIIASRRRGSEKQAATKEPNLARGICGQDRCGFCLAESTKEEAVQ